MPTASSLQISYVRNDPVNKIDPDGRDWWGPTSELQYLQSMGWNTYDAANMLYALPNIGGSNPYWGNMNPSYFMYAMAQAQFNASQYQLYLAQQAGGIGAGFVSASVVPSTKAGAVQALANDGCATWIGATNSQGAISGLINTPIGSYKSAPSVSNNADGTFNYTYSVAQYNSQTGVISLNSSITDPSHYLVNGQYVNLLTETEQTFGLVSGSLTNETFWAIYVIHEIGHQTYRFRNDLNNVGMSESYTQQVINNCFGDLIQKPPL